jgi:hypothetical protein
MLRNTSSAEKPDSCREHPQMRLPCVEPASEDAPYTNGAVGSLYAPFAATV